jgi:hypothetical protein
MTPALVRRKMMKHAALVAGAALALGACDLSVDNTAPKDASLDQPQAFKAVVNGAHLALSLAIGQASFFGGDAAREITEGGRIHPTKLPVIDGQMTVDGIPNNPWNAMQTARFVGEDAARRISSVLGADAAKNTLYARALLYAGYANRLIAENNCETVIDGGAATTITDSYKRAEDFFTKAIDAATASGDATALTAAHAGRASVRLVLKNNAGALEDAALVPNTFVFQAAFDALAEANYNFIYWVSANQPYRSHTLWHTYADQYFTDTGDPRVAYAKSSTVPNAELTGVPWYFQQKFKTRDAPVNLSSGREMRLIEAEIALRNNDVATAMAKINSIRTTVVSMTTTQPLAALTAADITEAWTHLRHERFIELFLEARRLGDLRRWVDDKTPGTLTQYENIAGTEAVGGRVRLCLPIAQVERANNGNVGLTHVDPKNPLYTGTLQ